MHVRTYVRTINYDDTHLLLTKAGVEFCGARCATTHDEPSFPTQFSR